MSCNIRVLHLIESAGLYGAEQVILNLAHAQLREGNVSPVIGCIVDHPNQSSQLYDEAVFRGISALKIVLPVATYFLHLNAFKQQLIHENIQILHCHGYKPVVFGFVPARLAKVVQISTCHNWIINDQSPLKMKLMIHLEKWLYRFFPKVIGVSEPIVDTLRKLNLHEEKIELIYNGIAIESDLPTARYSLGISDDDFIVINVARLCPVKNQALLIHAFKHFRDHIASHPQNTYLLFVGDGEDKKRLEDLVQQYDLTDVVIFLGFRNDVPALLGMCDCFCLSSNDEGLPISLLEAVAAKCPVIATDVGSISAVIRNQESGTLIPSSDEIALTQALINTWKTPDNAQQMAAVAYDKLLSQFTDSAMANAYHHVYQEVLKA